MRLLWLSKSSRQQHSGKISQAGTTDAAMSPSFTGLPSQVSPRGSPAAGSHTLL